MVDFGRVKSSVDLREVVLRYTTLDRSDCGPCPLCGDGHDRFYIHRGNVRCGCRVCGFQGDVIELVHKVEGVTRAEAAMMLGGNQIPDRNYQWGRSRVFTVYKKEPETPPAWLDPAWQEKARTIVEKAEARLIDSPGSEYFEGRGITAFELLKSQRIGYVPDKFGRPAVVLPWFAGDSVTAIKYRFIDQGQQRFAQEKGSAPILYGPIRTESDSGTLIVVEGELNALALAQAAAPKQFDVVSVGAEGNTKGLDALATLIEDDGYSRLLFWFDKLERAAAAANRFQGSAAMRSPAGRDAADLLKEHGCKILLELVDTVLANRYKDAAAMLKARVRGAVPIVTDRDQLGALYDALGECVQSCRVRQLFLDVDKHLLSGKSLEPLYERLIEMMAVDRQNGTRWVLDLIECLFPEINN